MQWRFGPPPLLLPPKAAGTRHYGLYVCNTRGRGRPSEPFFYTSVYIHTIGFVPARCLSGSLSSFTGIICRFPELVVSREKLVWGAYSHVVRLPVNAIAMSDVWGFHPKLSRSWPNSHTLYIHTPCTSQHCPPGSFPPILPATFSVSYISSAGIISAPVPTSRRPPGARPLAPSYFHSKPL